MEQKRQNSKERKEKTAFMPREKKKGEGVREITQGKEEEEEEEEEEKEKKAVEG